MKEHERIEQLYTALQQKLKSNPKYWLNIGTVGEEEKQFVFNLFDGSYNVGTAQDFNFTWCLETILNKFPA